MHLSSLSPRWSPLLWPLALLLNGWILETLFAQVMNQGVKTSNHYYLWWAYGDIILQWLIYGAVACALVHGAFMRLRPYSITALDDDNDGADDDSFETCVVCEELIWALVLMLLAMDVSFRYQWRSPWLAGTVFQKPSWNKSTGLINAAPDPMDLYYSLVHNYWQWATRPLWVFLFCAVLAWLCYSLRFAVVRRTRSLPE